MAAIHLGRAGQAKGMLWSYSDHGTAVSVLELADILSGSADDEAADLGWQWAGGGQRQTTTQEIGDTGALVLSKVPGSSADIRAVIDNYQLSPAAKMLLLATAEERQHAETHTHTLTRIASAVSAWMCWLWQWGGESDGYEVIPTTKAATHTAI